MKRRQALLLSMILSITLGLIVFGLGSDTLQKKNPTIFPNPQRISTLGYYDVAQRISKNGRYASWPAIAINNADVLMACFAQDIGDGFLDIYYTMSFDKGDNWTGDSRIFSIEKEPKCVDLAADAGGNFHLIYSDGVASAEREIYHREFSNNAWGPETQISTSIDNANWCAVACDGNKVHIAWYQELGGSSKPTIYLKTRNEDGTWPSTPEDVMQDPKNGGVYACVAAANGNVYVAWQRQNYSGDSLQSKEAVFREKRGDTWLPTVPLGSWAYPGIAADTLGNAHVIWSDQSKAKYRMKTGDTWEDEKQVDTRGAIVGFYKTAFKNNTLIAVFMQDSTRGSGDYSVWYRTRQVAPGGFSPFGTAIETSSGRRSDLPHVAMDNEGYAHLLWTDEFVETDGLPNVFYNKFLVGGPAAPFIALDKYTLSYSLTQGDTAPSQTFKVKNSGPDTINFQVTSLSEFVSVTPASGTSTGDWVTITVDIDTRIPIGLNTGKVQISSDEAENSPVELTVSATILQPPIFPPLNFKGVQESNGSAFYREYVNHLTWNANPLNEDITHYRITIEFEKNNMSTTQILEIESSILEYVHHSVDPNTEYTYTIKAVDENGAEGQTATVIIGD